MNVISALHRRVTMMLGIGNTTQAANETGGVQQLQVTMLVAGSAAETRDNVASMQFYGFSSSPVPGARHLIGFLSGDRKKGIAIASSDPRYRPTGMKAGEVMIHDNQGRQIYLSASGIVINCNGSPLTINGNVAVNGAITATGDVKAGSISLQDHVHPYTPGTGAQADTGLPTG